MKRGALVHSPSGEAQRSSVTGALRSLYRLSAVLATLTVTLAAPLLYVSHLSVQLQAERALERPKSQQSEPDVSPPPFVIPSPLPFPELRALDDQRSYSFRIPNAEFSLQVSAPREWAWRALTGDVVRFAPESPSSPEPGSVLTFSSGCFGSCDDLSDNISSSLQQHIQALTRQGMTPRVTHWHVHHRGWVEYSLLTDSPEGQATLTGVSMRWEEEWLNALRCEMSAPIDYPLESEELLHLAWNQWAPLFLARCRDYKVLSWN